MKAAVCETRLLVLIPSLLMCVLVITSVLIKQSALSRSSCPIKCKNILLFANSCRVMNVERITEAKEHCAWLPSACLV